MHPSSADAAAPDAPDAASDYIGAVDALARKLTTPMGDGEMVWRLWGEGPPVLLCHGNYGSWLHWIRNIGALASRYTVIVPDLPGFGESAEPTKPYDSETAGVEMAKGFADVVGESDGIRIVGFSFGNLFATLVAWQLAARVSKLVLVAASRGLELPSLKAKTTSWRAAKTHAERMAAHRHNLVAQMFADPASVDDLALEIQARNVPNARPDVAAMGRPDAPLKSKLPLVSCEISAIWGEKDVVIGPHMDARIDWLENLRPGARYAIIPGAGHWAQYEAADEFDATLQRFLD